MTGAKLLWLAYGIGLASPVVALCYYMLNRGRLGRIDAGVRFVLIMLAGDLVALTSACWLAGRV